VFAHAVDFVLFTLKAILFEERDLAGVLRGIMAVAFHRDYVDVHRIEVNSL
jgi:hypothetical protein